MKINRKYFFALCLMTLFLTGFIYPVFLFMISGPFSNYSSYKVESNYIIFYSPAIFLWLLSLLIISCIKIKNSKGIIYIKLFFISTLLVAILAVPVRKTDKTYHVDGVINIVPSIYRPRLSFEGKEETGFCIRVSSLDLKPFDYLDPNDYKGIIICKEHKNVEDIPVPEIIKDAINKGHIRDLARNNPGRYQGILTGDQYYLLDDEKHNIYAMKDKLGLFGVCNVGFCTSFFGVERVLYKVKFQGSPVGFSDKMKVMAEVLTNKNDIVNLMNSFEKREK